MYLNKIILSILTSCMFFVTAEAKAKNIDLKDECELVLLYSNISIKKCLLYYSNKLKSISIKKKEQYEDTYRSTKEDYEMLLYLFADYPKAKVLFSKLLQSEKLNKASKNDVLGLSEIKDYYSKYRSYDHDAYSYDILFAMLKAQKNLNNEDRYMLAVSKQRSQCLHNILNGLKEGDTIPASNIIDKCYIHVDIK